MADRVVLHIGSMKSGTSFIQNVLGNNREALAEHGISFAGERWRDQVTAVQDLIAHGGPRQEPLDPAGPWRRLVDEINATPGTSVVSMEFLAPRVTAKIELLRDALQGDLQVVLTGRDLARNIAAMWLESVQNGSAVDWDAYLAAVRSEDRSQPVARNFWNHQGLAEIAAPVGGRGGRGPLHPDDGAAQGRPVQPAVGALRAGPAPRPAGLRARRAGQPVDRAGHRDDPAAPQRAARGRRLHRRQVLRPAGQAPAHQARPRRPAGPGAPPRPRRALGDEARRRRGRRAPHAAAPRGRRPRRAAARAGPRRAPLAGLAPSSSWRPRWRACPGWCRSASSARASTAAGSPGSGRRADERR